MACHGRPERNRRGNVKRGADVERRTDFSEGKPLKGKPHECVRYETRPERGWVEQGVERLRKPENAAQPGEVIPVLVATHFQNAGGAGNLRRASLAFAGFLYGSRGKEAVWVGLHVRVGRKVMRGEPSFCRNEA
jgi:hypothetical protein